MDRCKGEGYSDPIAAQAIANVMRAEPRGNEGFIVPINYQSQNPTVNGRDLHSALEVETEYRHWFTRMCEYGFIEGRDFRSFLTESTGGRPGTDHAISIAMANELCMLQRSEMGRRFRQYFIAIEEAWNSPEKIMERALTIAHQRAIEAEHRIISLTTENEELAIALNTSLDYWTVMKYNTEMNKKWTMGQCQIIGRRMSAYCRTHGYEIKPCLTSDERFSSVNSYPITAWKGFMGEAAI
jgi:phage anti-repressor protein